jgi:hypothetical protein
MRATREMQVMHSRGGARNRLRLYQVRARRAEQCPSVDQLHAVKTSHRSTNAPPE